MFDHALDNIWVVHRGENTAFIQRLRLLLWRNAADVNLHQEVTTATAATSDDNIAHLLHDVKLPVASPPDFEHCAAIAPSELV